VVRSQQVQDVHLLLMIDSELAAAIRTWFLPFELVRNCISHTNRSMLGAYWTIWSQKKPPSSVLSKIVVGFSEVKLLPTSVEYD
jgi:hypothetical protein